MSTERLRLALLNGDVGKRSPSSSTASGISAKQMVERMSPEQREAVYDALIEQMTPELD